jgi:hypothetical protein
MADTRVAAACTAAAGPIENIGATWMLDPAQHEISTNSGYGHPFMGYMAGRAGTLGDVDARIVDAVFGVFAPQVIDMLWEGGKPVHGAKGGAELYFSQAADWGRQKLAGVEGLDRVVELGEKVIDAAPGLGLPLFVGWRMLPRVDDTAGRAMQVLLVLRELRGSIHIAAMAAHGLGAPEGHMLNKGAEYCAFFGWPEPFPNTDHLKAKKDEIEEVTNNRVAEIVGSVLSAEEAEELARISTEINNKLTAA